MNLYVRASIAAAGAAALFALSPLSALCGGAMALVTWRAIAGYEGVERRWVGGALIIGTLLRVGCVLGLFLLTSSQEQFNVLFGDGRFAVDRSTWMLNLASGVPLSPYQWLRTFENYGDVQYHHALAVLQWIAGPSPYALSLVNVLSFEVFAVLFYRLARQAFGATVAMATLTLLLFWPTIFVWSFSMLKESTQYVLLAVALTAAVSLIQKTTVTGRLGALAVTVLALWTLNELRPGGTAMAGAAIVFGLIAYAATRRSWIACAAAVVTVAAVLVAVTRPAIQDRMLAESRLALSRHVGHVNSEGISYHAADQRFYTSDHEVPFTATPEELFRFLARSAVAFFVVPLPSDIGSLAGWAYLPLNLAWWALLALAIWGAPTAVREAPLVAWMSIAYVAAGVAVIAPNSGNVGTLVRHRDMVVPFVMLLGSVGLVALLAALTSRFPSLTRPGLGFGRAEGEVFNAAH